MKKSIAVAAMAIVVVIAGITAAAHAAVFFSPAATAVMSSFVVLSKSSVQDILSTTKLLNHAKRGGQIIKVLDNDERSGSAKL